LSDFTDKTFNIMDSIHKSEGKVHEITGWTLDEAVEYFKKNACVVIKETQDDYQRVFILKKVL